MLHSQIATTADLALLRMSVSRPNESIVEYSRLPHPYETDLYREMQARYGDLEILTKIFRYAKEATSELGQWCADQVWSFAMAEQEALKFERRVEKNYSKAQDTKPVEMLDDEMNRLREAQKFVMNWDFPKPTEDGNSLSSKVLHLRVYLDSIYQAPAADARCIVFVDRRYTARLLHDLFARIGTSHLRAGLLVGARNGEPGDLVLSVRQQILTLNKFRKGLVNCLVTLSHDDIG